MNLYIHEHNIFCSFFSMENYFYIERKSLSRYDRQKKKQEQMVLYMLPMDNFD